MKVLRARCLDELNTHTRDHPSARGMLEAANWLNEQSDMTRNGYAMGDVLLCKFNLISKRQLRKRK